MKYTQHNLDKLERVLEELEYVVRYERGNFQSGYCILEQKKVVVLNKFLQLEGRINTMMDLIPKLVTDPTLLTTESRKLYEDIRSRQAAENQPKEEQKEDQKEEEEKNEQ
ncbi:MAG: hypothetical protein ACXWV5_02905 [Flavitalea sp.]